MKLIRRYPNANAKEIAFNSFVVLFSTFFISPSLSGNLFFQFFCSFIITILAISGAVIAIAGGVGAYLWYQRSRQEELRMLALAGAR